MPSTSEGTRSTVIPTRRATPRYMGYLAMAVPRSPKRSFRVGKLSKAAKPRARKPFITGSSERISRTWSRKSRTTVAVGSERRSLASTGRGSRPVSRGSVSPRSAPPRLAPRMWSTTRCSFSGMSVMVVSAGGSSLSFTLATTRRASSSEGRPARRSLTRPSSSKVARFRRAATSPCSSSSPTPRADSAPRPMTHSVGS